MHKIRCMITIVLILFSYDFLNAQYQLIEAFPNLSFDKPVLLTFSPDQTNRIFVVEQEGLIKVFPNDPEVTTAQVKTFLDISDKIPGGVAAYGEYGLLGLAFHPDYAENGIFFIDYVTLGDTIRTHISRYLVSSLNPDIANDTTETILLEVDQVLDNHNAGMLCFGNDGYLYASLGDGGWAYPSGQPDPDSTAQDLRKLLGSIIRIDVDTTTDSLEYGIPPDNPFAGNEEGYREEIYGYGFRNPWRFSIDHVTGKIWVGDVGFANWEEINILEPGKNYGWSQAEGMECRPGVDCNIDEYEMPVLVYETGEEGCAITGGVVYRGEGRPELAGKYIYGDWCLGTIWSMEDNGDSTYTNTLLTDESIRISSFGLDENYELYVVDLDFFNPTKIYRFEPVSTSVEEANQMAKSFSLSPNYPNPFNPSTKVSYKFETETDFEITVYDMMGRKIRLLESGHKGQGVYSAIWDGKNDNGELVGSGVYAIRLKCGNKQFLRKAMLLK